MGVMSHEVNYDLLLSDLANCCLQLGNCGSCKKGKCLVGYAKESMKNCLKDDITYIMNGCENIPLNDVKSFEQEILIESIVDILKQCKSCKEDHYDNCLINVMRSSYEVCLFGEVQKYKGSTITYLTDISEQRPEIAEIMLQKYNAK